jgi:hypothetical protein
MKQFLFVLSAALLLFLGCKKDDDDEPEQVAITKENIAGSYKINIITLKEGTSEQNYTDSLLDACSKDDILNFRADKTYTQIDEGAKCNPSENYEGTWDLPSTTKFILDSSLYDLDKFDGKALEISLPFGVNTSGQVVSIVFKFQKQ